MKKYTLRPHQADMIEQIGSEVTFGASRLIIDACPAYGKSLLMAEVASLYQEEGVVILINITALLDQISEHLTAQGVDHSILKADRPAEFDPDKKVQLVMSQTLHARIGKINFKHTFKIYQQDEMHRENPDISKRTRECVNFLGPEVIIGYSGTPYDQNGYKFNNYDYLSNVHAQDLQDKGNLCPIKYYVPKWAETIDFSAIKKSGNDYNSAELESIINTEAHLRLALGSMNELGAKGKKTLIFCSSIEQANKFTAILRDDGYNAEAFHSQSEHSDRVVEAFKSNGTYNKAPKGVDSSLFKDDNEIFREYPVECLVSINRLGIGFDSPDTVLAVQLRPTKVRSLFVQQVMRVARTHKSKQYSEYLDLGQTTSSFGFHTDLYSPPMKSEDKVQNQRNIDEANQFSMEDMKSVLRDELEEIERPIYNVRLEEIKAKLKRPLTQMSIKELAAAFDVSRDHKEIIKIACLIYTFKFGKPVSKAGSSYSYKPDSFWGTNTWGTNEHFHVPHTMEEYFEMVPEKKSSWIRALRTRCRNIIKKGDKLFKITGFIKFMYDKHQEDSTSFVADYRKDEHEMAPKYEIDIDDEEIPF